MRREKLKELKSYINELNLKKNQLLDKSGKFLTVERYLCELNNGQVISREKIMKNGSDGNACIILPITASGNVLLVVQPRVFTANGVCVELPAGYVEDGEDYEKAGTRELFEETGYVPEKMMCIASFYQDQGCSAAYNKSFLAEGCHKISSQHLDKDEIIRCFECSYDEALELIDMGFISDVNSQLTFEKSKRYVRR